MCYPATHEGSGYRLCRDICNRNGFWPPREPIITGEYVPKFFGRREWANDVNVHYVKPRIRSGEGRQGCNRVCVNFRALAFDARFSPPFDARFSPS